MVSGSQGAGDLDGALTLSADEERVVRAFVVALRSIRHGSVQITVQDGIVVQMDTLQKRRFSREATHK